MARSSSISLRAVGAQDDIFTTQPAARKDRSRPGDFGRVGRIVTGPGRVVTGALPDVSAR